MADSYATAVEYRSRTNNQATSEDTEIMAQIEAMSRVLDSKLHIFDGDLAPTAEETRSFLVERYAAKLWLRDDGGRAHFLRTVTSITVGGEDLALRAVGLRPMNQDHKTALLRLTGTWPANVEIAVTGEWGLAAIPAAAREWVIAQTRDLRDTQLAGAAGRVEVIDYAVEMRHEQWRILRQLAASLSRDVGLRR